MNPYKDIQPRIQSIPQERIIRKMDEYMSRRDYAGAERHLKYWLEEAKMGNDRRGELLIRNELVGHFRKTGNRDSKLELSITSHRSEIKIERLYFSPNAVGLKGLQQEHFKPVFHLCPTLGCLLHEGSLAGVVNKIVAQM